MLASLRGASVVESEHSAEPLATADLFGGAADFILQIDDLVAEALMISLRMVVAEKLRNSRPQRPLAEKDQSIEALLLQGSEEPFHMGVQIR